MQQNFVKLLIKSAVILNFILISQGKTTLKKSDGSFWEHTGPSFVENYHVGLQTFGATLFKPIGLTASSFNYAHLAFNIDFTVVDRRFEHLDHLERRLKEQIELVETPSYRQQFEHVIRMTGQEKQFIVDEWKTVRSLFSSSTIVGTTDPKLEKFLDLNQTFDNSTGRREKRFALGLGLAATTLFGLFSGYELNNLIQGSNRNEYLIQRIDDNEDNILMFARHMSVLNQTMYKVLELSQRNSAKIRFSTYRAYIASIIRLETNQVGKLVSGLEALLEHRLSPKLLRLDTLTNALNLLSDLAKKEGFNLAIEQIIDVFQCETSFQLSNNGNVIRIFVHVPIYRPKSVLQLYQYIETPQLTNDSIHAFSMASDQDVIAVSENDELFFATRLVELNECKKLHQWRFCEMTNVMQAYFNASCISSLYAGLAEDCNRLCQFKQLPDRPTVTPIGKATFVVYHPRMQTITMACGSEIVQNMFKGIRRIVLKPGCRAISDSQQLVYDKSLRLDIEVKVQPLNFTEIEAGFLLGYLNQMDKVDVPSVIDPVRIRKTKLRFVPIWVSTGLTLIIIVVVFLVFLRFKRRIKASLRRVLFEGTRDEENVGTAPMRSSFSLSHPSLDVTGGRMDGTVSTPVPHAVTFDFPATIVPSSSGRQLAFNVVRPSPNPSRTSVFIDNIVDDTEV